MRIQLAYGKGTLTVDVPPSFHVDTFETGSSARQISYDDFHATFQQSGGATFCAAPLLIVVNDSYRHTPTSRILDWLSRYDPATLTRSHFLIATGSHRVPTPEELAEIFGAHYASVRDRIISHVSTDMSTMTRVGTDQFGADVFVNSHVLTSERILIIGSVEPHYFAGYTGGRKSIFPGATDLATIERNHNLASSLDAAPLKLTGNPVAEHLQSLMQLIDSERFFSIQMVVDCGGRIGAVFMGRIENSFTNALPLANELFVCHADSPYDVVLCCVRPPLDRNLYQAQKALENCQSAVADGGVAVVVSPCHEGVGSEHFMRQAELWDPERNQPVDGIARFGSHKLSRMITTRKRIRVCLYSTLPPEVPAKVYYEPLDNIENLLRSVTNRHAAPRLAVVRDAANVVLQVN